MKFVSFKYDDKIYAGISDGNKVKALDFPDMNSLIRNFDGNVNAVKEFNIGEVKFTAPITEPLQDVICIGANYAEHAKESAMFKNIEVEERTYPVVFSKRVNYAIGDGEYIDMHGDINDSLDYECELAVIIGRETKNVSPNEAYDYLFGYTILNDISSRNLQSRYKQWYVGKSLDGFTAIGPHIVSRDEIENPQKLDVRCYVNDELRQNSNTSLMLFDVKYLISELSKGITLKPGTIISTGTPSGVGMGFKPPRFLKKGDIIRCEIENIGTLKNIVGKKKIFLVIRGKSFLSCMKATA